MPFFADMKINYDDFRRRLLRGREELYHEIEKPEGGVWVDMGGGTGANIENLSSEIERLKQVYVVDLSESLLKIAADRFDQHGWSNAQTVCADATQWQPPEGQADVVTFSYSLTMIPDWFGAIENAMRMLKPGGVIGVVDFYVGRKYPPEGMKQHGWLARNLWGPWFAVDNVFPSPDHVPFLLKHFEQVDLVEERLRMPYVPLLKTPYYRFIGRKR